MSTWRTVSTLIACCASFAVVALGQETGTDQTGTTNAQIIVHLHAAGGEPLAEPAIVKLYRIDGMPRGQATTNGTVPVVFNNLPLGGYYIEVSASGYVTAREEASLPIPVPVEVHIYLRPESPVDPTPAPAGMVLAPKAQKEVEKGLEALRENNLKEAKKRLESAGQMAPAHPDVLYLLGVLYIRLNELPHAQGVLEKAAQLNPQHARALAGLGTVLSNEGRYADAIPWLEKALAINDGVWETRWTLARAYYQQRQFQQSRAEAQQALVLAQGRAPEIQLLLAQALAALGERRKAAEELSAFLSKYPHHPKAAVARRWIQQLQ